MFVIDRVIHTGDACWLAGNNLVLAAKALHDESATSSNIMLNKDAGRNRKKEDSSKGYVFISF